MRLKYSWEDSRHSPLFMGNSNDQRGDRTSGYTRHDKERILLIDDDSLVLKGLRFVIEDSGYEALAASDEGQALALLAKADVPPDLIVSDYRLRGGRTGAQAIACVRRLFNATIPAVLMTGDTALDRLREAQAHGLRVLHKPVQATVLLEVIGTLLGR